MTKSTLFYCIQYYNVKSSYLQMIQTVIKISVCKNTRYWLVPTVIVCDSIDCLVSLINFFKIYI